VAVGGTGGPGLPVVDEAGHQPDPAHGKMPGLGFSALVLATIG